MTTNALTVEVGQEVVVTSTTVDENNAPVDPATCKFYLEAPNGAGPVPQDADAIGTTGVRRKYYVLDQRGTYGVTVRTTSPITVRSIHITTEWNAT